MAGARKIIIIAGPHGAGKTSFARSFLPREAECPVFINADLIAAGFAPFAPDTVADKAQRLMQAEITLKLATRQSFAIETTLSGLSYAKQIPAWIADGYSVKLFFLSLPSADIAVARVAARMAQGGHEVHEETIRRRFDLGLHNFHEVYKPLVDHWSLYDTSAQTPVLVDWGTR